MWKNFDFCSVFHLVDSRTFFYERWYPIYRNSFFCSVLHFSTPCQYCHLTYHPTSKVMYIPDMWCFSSQKRQISWRPCDCSSKLRRKPSKKFQQTNFKKGYCSAQCHAVLGPAAGRKAGRWTKTMIFGWLSIYLSSRFLPQHQPIMSRQLCVWPLSFTRAGDQLDSYSFIWRVSLSIINS